MKKICLLLLLVPLLANSQTVKTIAGNGIGGYSGNGGTAISAQLKSPDVVKFDHAGNLYIVDEGNHAIRKINAAGIISTVAGTGTVGYTGDGGPATNAELSRPTDIVFDASDNMYIGEFGNGTIRKVTPGGIITTIAGTGTPGYGGDNGPAAVAQLYDPLGLVFDVAGNLYFSDNGKFRVRKISTTGIITTIAGTGTLGYNGDNIPATTAQIRLTGYLAISSSGELYLPEHGSSRVRKIDAAGIITTVVGNGTATNTGDGGPATAATIAGMFAILFDPAGNMFLSDRGYGVIRKVSPAGIITTIAGIGSLGYGGDNGPATSAQFNLDMNCSAIDASGNLYIADPINNRVRRITYNGTDVEEVYNTAQNITLYPNPTKNVLTISADDKIESIEIINAIGQRVFAQSYLSSKTEIDVSSFANGIYFLKVNGVHAGRFVKE